MAAPVRELRPPPTPLSLLVELDSRRSEFLGNVRVCLARGARRLDAEQNLNGFSPRNLALSVLLHVMALAALLMVPVIRNQVPVVAEEKFPDPVMIYYPAPSLPVMKDAGGSPSGLRAETGGRSAFHPDQAIRVTRAVPLRPSVTDVPKLSLPQVTSPANLLSLATPSTSLPLLSAPVELETRPSKIRKPSATREANSNPVARLDLQKSTVIPADLATQSRIELPQLRPATRKQIATESAATATELQSVPLTAVPAVEEPVANRPGSGIRQELVISGTPGDAIGVPAESKAGSLMLTPKGDVQPGLGSGGNGAGTARGSGLGSATPAAGTGGGATGAGPGSHPAATAGISPERGPGGAGTGGTSVMPGVHISGGTVSLDSFGPHAVSGNKPSASLPSRKPAPITIVATSRSGGGLAAYGAFKNRTVYTVYFDTAAGQTVLQFAAQDGAAAYSAALIPPDPLSTDTPRGLNAEVVFSCVLDVTGHLQGLRVISGSFPTSAVEDAVRQWIFHPVLNGNQPIAVDALIGIGIGVH